MDNIIFIDLLNELTNKTETHAIIDRGNGEFTSMPKAVYEAQVEHLTSPLTTQPAGDVVQ